MKKHICPVCGTEKLESFAVDRSVDYRGIAVHVAGMESSTCSNCSYIFDTESQQLANVKKIKDAYLEQRTNARIEKGLLSGVEIRQIRERLGLSQKEAAKYFGGGAVAFSKYESEDVIHNKSMDQLLRLANVFGQQALNVLKQQKTSGEVGHPATTVVVHYVMKSASSVPPDAHALSATGGQEMIWGRTSSLDDFDVANAIPT